MSFFTAQYDDELSDEIDRMQEAVTKDIFRLRQFMNDKAEDLVNGNEEKVQIEVCFDGVKKIFTLNDLKKILGFDVKQVKEESSGAEGSAVQPAAQDTTPAA